MLDTLKKGSKFRVVSKFRVQRDMVAGLSLSIDTDVCMFSHASDVVRFGSFGPDGKIKTVKGEWRVVTGGALGQKNVQVRVQLVDADKTAHSSFTFRFTLEH